MIQKETRYYSNRLVVEGERSDHIKRMIPWLEKRIEDFIQAIADAAALEASSPGVFARIPIAMKPIRPAAEPAWRRLVAAYRQTKRMSIFFDANRTSFLFVVKLYGPGRGGPLLATVKGTINEFAEDMEVAF